MHIKILCLALMAFSLTNCSNPSASSKSNLVEEKTSVKDTLPKHPEQAATAIDTVAKIPDNICSVQVVYRNSYCGGAWPPQEVLDAYEKEYPLKNSTILLKDSKGKIKPLRVSTDKNGYMHTHLLPATYNYFMTEKYDANSAGSFNHTCEKWLARSFGTITLTEGQQKGYKMLFDYGCNPCEPPRP